jgi:hypothetical protein
VNDILILPPELSGNPTSSHLVARQKELGEGNDEFSFRTVFVNHHHMALQPKSGPGLPLWGFVTITFLQVAASYINGRFTAILRRLRHWTEPDESIPNPQAVLFK